MLILQYKCHLLTTDLSLLSFCLYLCLYCCVFGVATVCRGIKIYRRDGADVRDGEFLGQMPGVGVNVIKSLRATAEVTAAALKLRHIDPC